MSRRMVCCAGCVHYRYTERVFDIGCSYKEMEVKTPYVRIECDEWISKSTLKRDNHEIRGITIK